MRENLTHGSMRGCWKRNNRSPRQCSTLQKQEAKIKKDAENPDVKTQEKNKESGSVIPFLKYFGFFFASLHLASLLLH